MAKRGRPTNYPEMVKPRLDEIETWASQGWTRREISSALGINNASLHRYMNSYKELSDALKAGDSEIVANVQAALAKKALGGDVTAMIFFLKNKDPEHWRDKHQLEHSGGLDMHVDGAIGILEGAE
jgi:hypothetical protein